MEKKVFDLTSNTQTKRIITVYDIKEKKEVELDISFVPAAITLEYDVVREQMIQLQKKLMENRELTEKALESIRKNEKDEGLDEKIQALKEEINTLSQENAKRRLELAYEVLNLNGNDVKQEWLETHLDYQSLHDLSMIAPDVYYTNDQPDKKKEYPKAKN